MLAENGAMKRLLSLVLASALYWSGTMARAESATDDRQRAEAIFAAHDAFYASQNAAEIETYLKAVAEDIIVMPADERAVEGKDAYRAHLLKSLASGHLAIRHEVIQVSSFAEVVVVRGRAVGSFTPPASTTSFPFETKNVFLFRRLKSGDLQVWQVIFNRNPGPGPI